MDDKIELLYSIRAQGTEELEKIGKLTSGLGSATDAGSKSVDTLQKSMEELKSATQSLNPGMVGLDTQIKGLVASGMTLAQALQQVVDAQKALVPTLNSAAVAGTAASA